MSTRTRMVVLLFFVMLMLGSESKSTKAAVHDTAGAFLLDPVHKWPIVKNSREIPYRIETSSVPDQSLIQKGMAYWTANVPCIKFVHWAGQKDYLSFFKGQGCYSWVGRRGGPQRVSIGAACADSGAVIEQIGLALGFKFGKSLSTSEINQARLAYCPGTDACSKLYQDNHKHCQTWASGGYCDLNTYYKQYMNRNCKKSCLCRACEDKRQDCSAYVAQNFCTDAKYSKRMALECRRSCKFCS